MQVSEATYVRFRDALLVTLIRRRAIGNASYKWRDLMRTPIVREYDARVQASCAKRMVNEGWLWFQAQENRYSLNPARVDDAHKVLPRDADFRPEEGPAGPEGEEEVDARDAVMATLGPNFVEEWEARWSRRIEDAVRVAEARLLARLEAQTEARPTLATPTVDVESLRQELQTLTGKLATVEQQLRDARDLRGGGGVPKRQLDTVVRAASETVNETVQPLRRALRAAQEDIEQINRWRSGAAHILRQTAYTTYFTATAMDLTGVTPEDWAAASMFASQTQNNISAFLLAEDMRDVAHNARMLHVPLPAYLKHCGACGKEFGTRHDLQRVRLVPYVACESDGSPFVAAAFFVCAEHEHEREQFAVAVDGVTVEGERLKDVLSTLGLSSEGGVLSLASRKGEELAHARGLRGAMMRLTGHFVSMGARVLPVEPVSGGEAVLLSKDQAERPAWATLHAAVTTMPRPEGERDAE